jgi:hypothetical protein
MPISAVFMDPADEFTPNDVLDAIKIHMVRHRAIPLIISFFFLSVEKLTISDQKQLLRILGQWKREDPGVLG